MTGIKFESDKIESESIDHDALIARIKETDGKDGIIMFVVESNRVTGIMDNVTMPKIDMTLSSFIKGRLSMADCHCPVCMAGLVAFITHTATEAATELFAANAEADADVAGPKDGDCIH